MKIITSITSQPRQRMVLKLDNNESAIMRLYYYATQKSWYFDIEYKQTFVERKHVTDDTIGANTIPEGLETGEYVENNANVE